MPIDIRLTESLGTEFDEIGDLRSISGNEMIGQAVMVSIIDNVDLAAPTLTDTRIEEQRASIEAAVRNNVFTDAPIRVVVDDIDYEAEQIDYIVDTAHVTLPISTL